MRSHRLALAASLASAIALGGTASAHEFDHPAAGYTQGAPLGTGVNSGGNGASWKLLTTFATGNPHTDLDFFTQGGNTFVSAGTLAIGPNGGGQTIFRMTDGDAVAPAYVSTHASASCLSNPSAALGLQHDVEATPKEEAQLLIDATDAEGRCHDQGGAFGFSGAPQGGLELVDVTDITDPVEIGLTSHIGEAHTVNVDPKRPHIAYAVTSDAVDLNPDGSRQNEDPKDSDRFDLDGFEVVDMSSCMNFPEGASTAEKRAACRPEVFRYRYPSSQIVMGHSNKANVYGCHELEIYPDDRLTCGSGGALIVFDMAGAFDDNGTPTDFSDDRPRGTPLPCRVRDSSSSAAFATGAKVTDCVEGTDGADLTVPGWLAMGAPSLEGVTHLGSVHHMGRESATGAVAPDFGPSEDIDFNHEAELTASGRSLLATDERGGGVLPPGASCSPGVDNPTGNGGVHAYRYDGLTTSGPGTPEEAHAAYARQSDGSKAIYRAQVRTQPHASICTAHVFQQIPGENRIFMGWYSQGTQVVDFIERPDGTVDWREAGWFIPENANTWTSHVFKTRDNGDGTTTYWGATGDFALGEGGRSAVDVYEVTMPAAPQRTADVAALQRKRGKGRGRGPRR